MLKSAILTCNAHKNFDYHAKTGNPYCNAEIEGINGVKVR